MVSDLLPNHLLGRTQISMSPKNKKRLNRGLNPAKAAIGLRKAFDTVIEAAMAAKISLEAQRSATRGGGLNSNTSARTDISGSARGSAAGASGARDTGNAPTAAANNATAAAAVAVAPADPNKAEDAGKAGATEENSKVASLQRQLQALSARQEEANAAASAAVLAEGGGLQGEGKGPDGAAGASRLEVATRRCTELEDKVADLEGGCQFHVFFLRSISSDLIEIPPTAYTANKRCCRKNATH